MENKNYTLRNFKEWYVSQLKGQYGYGYFEDLRIIGETEKAVKFMARYGYEPDLEKTIFFWVPKSAIISNEEATKILADKIEKQQARFDRYAKILEFAKSNGVKGVRNKMRLNSILIKIEDAGLELPEELK